MKQDPYISTLASSQMPATSSRTRAITCSARSDPRGAIGEIDPPHSDAKQTQPVRQRWRWTRGPTSRGLALEAPHASQLLRPSCANKQHTQSVQIFFFRRGTTSRPCLCKKSVLETENRTENRDVAVIHLFQLRQLCQPGGIHLSPRHSFDNRTVLCAHAPPDSRPVGEDASLCLASA